MICEDNREYQKMLPAHVRLESMLNSEKLNLVFAHGSTRSIDEYILIDTDADYALGMLKEAEADILFIGHSHKPYHKILETSDGKSKHVINLGSVGKRKDGDPKGCYVIVHLSLNKVEVFEYPNLMRHTNLNISCQLFLFKIDH